MAETLTYDPSNDTTTLNEEGLTPDEQDSLKVGEEMAEKEGELLAGKYKDAAELEKAYVELQKSLEKRVMKLARQLGTPNLLTPKKEVKKRKRLRKILQQLP